MSPRYGLSGRVVPVVFLTLVSNLELGHGSALRVIKYWATHMDRQTDMGHVHTTGRKT